MRKLLIAIILILQFGIIGCNKDIEYITSIENISIDNIFTQKEEVYYIYFYKNDCEYCDYIKPYLENNSEVNIIKIYGVNFSDNKNKLINRAYENGEGTNFKYYVSGCSKYEDLYINGYPSLIKIENGVSYFVANGRSNVEIFFEEILSGEDTNE